MMMDITMIVVPWQSWCKIKFKANLHCTFYLPLFVCVLVKDT
uniref:Uncharacterized protein n=1 Tax=Rhizophora mucronata TaxID=61149 RepID=A0A2P2R2C2_RHIMU